MRPKRKYRRGVEPEMRSKSLANYTIMLHVKQNCPLQFKSYKNLYKSYVEFRHKSYLKNGKRRIGILGFKKKNSYFSPKLFFCKCFSSKNFIFNFGPIFEGKF
jgi:hypothetical protein